MTTASFAVMRKTKPCRKKCRKIGMWFDACVANLSFLILIALISVLTFKGLSLFRQPSPPPVAILIVGQTNNAAGTTLTQVLFTNASSHRLNYTFSVEVLRKGLWQDGSVQQSDAALANALPPRSVRLLSLPIPQEGDEWRVTLVARRALGGVETEVCQLFRRFNLEYPFAQEIPVSGPEMLNASWNELNSPQIAAGRLPLAGSAESNLN